MPYANIELMDQQPLHNYSDERSVQETKKKFIDKNEMNYIDYG